LPAFALLPYTDCAQRDCVLLQPGVPGAPPVLVIGNPFAEDLLQWADFALSTPFTVALAHPDDLAAYLLQQESVQQAMQEMQHGDDVPGLDQSIEDISLIRISEDSSPVVKLVNSTIYDALKFQASDIHLECDVASLVIKYRVDGVLVQAGQVQGWRWPSRSSRASRSWPTWTSPSAASRRMAASRCA